MGKSKRFTKYVNATVRYKGGFVARVGDTVRFVARGMRDWPNSAPLIATGVVVRVGERSVTVETQANGDLRLGGASFVVRLTVVAHRVSLVSREVAPVVGS